METVPLSAFTWVDQPSLLARMVKALAKQRYLAVDTESNSLYAYRERVCLIQFSSVDHDYVVDPFAVKDLAALGDLFADPGIEKIFHAAEYDLICLKRDYGFQFANLFDTMFAGRVLGKTALGLGGMLEAEFGLQLEKRYQRANWGLRPLTPAMQEYARQDTHYLIPLRHRLDAELRQNGLRELAQEDFNRLLTTPVQDGPEPDTWWKVAGSQKLTTRQAAVLQQLCDLREAQAGRMDLPLFKVMSNDVMVLVARNCPRDRKHLAEIPGMSPRMMARYANSMLEAVQHGLNAEPPPQRPHHPRPEQVYLDRLDGLKEWRKLVGKRMGVESDIILPRDVLEDIAAGDPQNLKTLGKIMATVPWRFERFGNDILKQLVDAKQPVPEA
jgi:ribonuclease D